MAVLPLRGTQTDKRMPERNLMKVNRDECEVLHLGRNNPRHQYMLWTDWLEISSAEKDLRILVNNRLTTS